MWKNSAFLLLFLAGLIAFAQDNSKSGQNAAQSEFKIPPEAAKEVNPVKPTPESLARAKKTYSYDCSMCHGANGDGKGDLAGDMKVPMLDYRDPKTLKEKTDGELAYIIKNGKGEMPGEGTRANAERTWDLVNYIRSFAKKDVATAAKSKDQTP